MLNVLSVFTHTLSMADCVDMPSIAENAAKHVMEHALLNDEKVLQEIQKSLEGDQMSFLENNVKSAVA